MKNIIRKKALSLRLKLSQNEIEDLSEKITKKVKRLPEFKNAKTILLYHPIKNEVDPTSLFNLKKKIVFPLIKSSTHRMTLHRVTDLCELRPCPLKIKSPTEKHPIISVKKIDLVIAPGLAFDSLGHRIGYGKGYFDKLFKSLSTNCVKIALAYDFQIIENVPAESHDRKVDLIVTEKRIIRPL